VTVAVLPASFDPITCGHVDIVTRASRLFDRLVVAVYAHPKKNVMFSLQDRLAMVEESLAHLDRVEVRSFDGLVVNLCREIGADVVVRGLRAVSDFEYEFQQAALNRQMLPGLEVISMFAGMEHVFLSSSIIKDIAENGGDVSSMVPPAVAWRLAERIASTSASVSSGGTRSTF
jgi:pantetheine-phosphate adenylyltransferase